MHSAFALKSSNPASVQPTRQATCHPSLGLVLVDHAAGFNITQAAFDFLADMDVVLDVLQRGVVRKVIEKSADGFFGCLHGGTHQNVIARPGLE
jgi:hypothetical protein